MRGVQVIKNKTFYALACFSCDFSAVLTLIEHWSYRALYSSVLVSFSNQRVLKRAKVLKYLNQRVRKSSEPLKHRTSVFLSTSKPRIAETLSETAS